MDWPTGKYGAILADPPWQFKVWSRDTGLGRSAELHYGTMSFDDLATMPVADLAAEDCALFCWACWPSIDYALRVVDAWGFNYKTMAFVWVKGEGLPLFPDDIRAQVGMGYWTRANTEPCILATRGSPKRLHADVSQVIIERRREHSRKPDCVHGRIERLVAGPYLELFARQRRPGWDCWGNEPDKFAGAA